MQHEIAALQAQQAENQEIYTTLMKKTTAEIWKKVKEVEEGNVVLDDELKEHVIEEAHFFVEVSEQAVIEEVPAVVEFFEKSVSEESHVVEKSPEHSESEDASD